MPSLDIAVPVTPFIDVLISSKLTGSAAYVCALNVISAAVIILLDIFNLMVLYLNGLLNISADYAD